MRTERVDELASLTELASGAAESIRLSTAANHIPEEEAKTQALAAIGDLRYRVSGYFSVTNDQGIVFIHPAKAIVGTNAAKTPNASGFNFVQNVVPRAAVRACVRRCIRFRPRTRRCRRL